MRTLFVIFMTIVLLTIAGAVFYFVSDIENIRYDLTSCTVYRWKQSLKPEHNYSYTEHLTPEKCEQLKKELLK